jgi:UDP-N-acetylmuramoyl-tripeptide--D-alanyl-D-alanine ligase
MKAAIGVLSSLPAGRRIAVLADMKELGENTIQFHREVGAFLAEKPVDILVVYGELAQAIAEGAKKVKPDLHVVSFEEDEKEDMLDWLDAQIGEGDAVLFKGSNSMKLGETAARFISVEKTPTSSGGK